MIKHLKIILLRVNVFLIFSTILVSCLELEYNKNKIIIKSFTLEKMDNFFELNFNVDYYSDSTISNYYAETIEKGLDGINGEIVFFGALKEEFIYSDSCQYLKFNDIALKINEKEDPFEGQNLGRIHHKICIPQNLDSISSNIVLIIKNEDCYDTIYNTTNLVSD